MGKKEEEAEDEAEENVEEEGPMKGIGLSIASIRHIHVCINNTMCDHKMCT